MPLSVPQKCPIHGGKILLMGKSLYFKSGFVYILIKEKKKLSFRNIKVNHCINDTAIRRTYGNFAPVGL